MWAGADAMNRNKVHNYLTVFADLLANRVLFATPGKDAPVWRTFGLAFLRCNRHPKAILSVAIEMSKASNKGVSGNLGNARLVDNKFHVILNLEEVCDDVRKAESRTCAWKRDR